MVWGGTLQQPILWHEKEATTWSTYEKRWRYQRWSGMGLVPLPLEKMYEKCAIPNTPQIPGNPFSVSCRALKKCQGIIKPVQGRSDLPLGSGHWSSASGMVKFFQDRKALKLYQPYLLMYHTYYHSQSSSPAKKNTSVLVNVDNPIPQD